MSALTQINRITLVFRPCAGKDCAMIVQSGYFEVPAPAAHSRHALRTYWEERGNPRGLPVMVLHGGPGGGARPGLANIFDPDRWRIILYDQLGCGRSEPNAADVGAELEGWADVHRHLGQLFRLMRHLGLGWAHLFGSSWGSTLALSAAQANRASVRGLILGPVTTTSAAEIDWLYGGLARFLPEAFAAFSAPFPKVAPGRPLVAAYGEALKGPDAQSHADRWCAWEQAAVAMDPDHRPSDRWADPRFRLGFARLCAWTFRDCAGMADRAILDQLHLLRDLPVEMVHSRFDLSCPPDIAWTLARDLPRARLTLLPGGLHSATETAMCRALRAATDRMADTA